MARLCRLDPTFEHPDPELFAIRLHSVLSRPQPEPGALDWALRSVPLELRSMYLKHWSDPAANRAELLRRIDAALVELTEREERLRTGREAVERSLAQEKALLIEDPQVARLWIRYYSESNSLYFRASRELRKSLAEDEDETHDEGSEGTAVARSPNEANRPLGEALKEELVKSSDVSAVVILPPVLGTTGATPVPPGVRQAPDGAPVSAETSTAVIPKPQPADANAVFPNEANRPAGRQLTLGEIKAYVECVAPFVGPAAVAVVTTIEALLRPDLDAAQRALLEEALDRDVAALDVALTRLEQRVA
jgi:hypothetical protein